MSIIDTLGGIFAAIDNRHLPHVIEDRSAAGRLVRRFVQRRQTAGAVEYLEHSTKPIVHERVAEAVVRHRFSDLASLCAYLAGQAGGPSAFLYESDRAVRLDVLNLERPECGTLAMVFTHHATWRDWTGLVDRSHAHGDLYDFVADRADYLAPNSEHVLPQLSRLNGASAIEYELDAETGESIIRTKTGATSAAATLPRKIPLSLPVFEGAWPRGTEPRVAWSPTLRVVAPKGEQKVPLLRIGAGDRAYALQAGHDALILAVRAALEAVKVPVYLATPDVKTFDVLVEAGR